MSDHFKGGSVVKEILDGLGVREMNPGACSGEWIDTRGAELVSYNPTDGEPIEALNGRYGPYIRKGKETRSIETEEQLFTVTLDEALKLLAEPKRRRGQRAAAAPLKEFGSDPASGKPVVLKSGRYGPYVTDGETNASLRKADDPETITEERAYELLADRRAKLGK